MQLGDKVIEKQSCNNAKYIVVIDKLQLRNTNIVICEIAIGRYSFNCQLQLQEVKLQQLQRCNWEIAEVV